ncbi:MAG: hypothetical protein M1825_004257 [Sarcosagium campestre]|nr:MAG: hypothetical protein M1825_004257 [Sarcosagium campestre]
MSNQHRVSPHLSHLDHPGSTPTTPSPPYPQYVQPHMSTMSQQNASRQPTSYPSPHSYPSPSMSAYAYPPPQQQQQQSVEPYRASPTGSHMPLPSLSLPPIRVMDNRNAPQGQASMGSPHNHSVAPMGAYFAGPGQSLPPPQQHINVTSSPINVPLRYPLPAPDGRIMSGGRHKKEIKRRTKTGCLTCRKRRIKCDEAHPSCRNCQKSKRECLGYDPIFKAQPGPTAIQPAPSSGPSMSAAPAQSAPISSAYPSLGQGYPTPGTSSFAPALSAGASSPGSSVEPYDYSAAIDPALEAAATGQMAMPSAGFDGNQNYRQDLKRGLDSASPFSSAASDTQNPRGGATLSSCPAKPQSLLLPLPAPLYLNVPIAHTNFPAKRIKIDDLFAIGGVVPPPSPPAETTLPLDQTTLDDIKHFYFTHYAPSLDRFLETKWFSNKSLPFLLNDVKLCNELAMILEHFRSVPAVDDPDSIAIFQSTEAKLIWSLMCLSRSALLSDDKAPGANGAADQGNYSGHGAAEVFRRVHTFEALVTGVTLDNNPTEVARLAPAIQASPKGRELEFWRLLGESVTLRENETQATKPVNSALSAARNILDNCENRDILYSIAITRHLGQANPDFPHNMPEPESNDEEDDLNKLVVAKDFLERETDTTLTTTVFQRLCAMAVCSWTAGIVES